MIFSFLRDLLFAGFVRIIGFEIDYITNFRNRIVFFVAQNIKILSIATNAQMNFVVMGNVIRLNV